MRVYVYKPCFSSDLFLNNCFPRYPLDAKAQLGDRANDFKTADDDILRELALTYSEQYPDMHSGHGCGSKAPTQFPSGITNGDGWRQLPYSLQDYAYLDLNILTVTPHIHCCHYVSEVELPKLYKNNERSLLAMLDKVRQATKGGVVDKLKVPLRNAYVKVHGRHTIINVTKDYGSFYRVLPQGHYKLIAHAPGYSSVIREVVVGPEVKTHVGFSLNKFVTDYKYRSPKDVESILDQLSKRCSDIMRLYTIGKTVEGRAIQVVELSDNPGMIAVSIAKPARQCPKPCYTNISVKTIKLYGNVFFCVCSQVFKNLILL